MVVVTWLIIILFLRPRSYDAAQIFEKAALFPPVKPTVHTNPSRKCSFSKTLFKPEVYESAGLAL